MSAPVHEPGVQGLTTVKETASFLGISPKSCWRRAGNPLMQNYWTRYCIAAIARGGGCEISTRSDHQRSMPSPLPIPAR